MSTLSHDSRFRLQVIQTSGELLRIGELSQEQRNEVEHILAIVRRIAELVHDLLDIGRIEAGIGMDTELRAIDDIIASSAGSSRGLAQTKGLKSTIDLPAMLALVKGSPLRLDQVIGNLVSNG